MSVYKLRESSTSVSVPYVKPDYTKVKGIHTSDSGLGLSNIRKPQSKLDLIDPMAKYNPNGFSLAEYENERHINKLFTSHYKDSSLIDEEKQDPDYVFIDIIKMLEEPGPVAYAFFSQKNIDHIQKLLIEMIYFQSDGLYKISKQNENIILEGMRLTYLGSPINGLATGSELRRIIANLNKNMLNILVPYVFSGIQKYLSYVRDQSNMARPIALPQNMSETGTRISRGFDSFII